MESVKEFAQACLGSFEELADALKRAGAEILVSMPPDEFQWQFGRFKIWCGTLGALQRGKSSLDSRLRESSVVRSNVSKHLASLYRTLENSIEVVSGARLPLEKQPAYTYSNSESSSEESDDGEEPPLPEELVLHMRTIKEILSDLYKLSFRIRNQSTRASSTLRPKLYSEIDPDTGIDKFAAYKDFDKRHVEESLLQLRKDAIWQTKKKPVESTQVTNSDRYLTDRLVTTMNRRRKALRYSQRHAQKLNEMSSEAKDTMKPRVVPKVQMAKVETRTIVKKPSKEGHLATPSLAEKTVLSGTEATRFENHLDNMLETRSIISYAPTLLGLYGDGVDLPAPPPAASERSEFLCSYCGLIYPARHGEGRAWRSHILHDLQPYICTYERCEDGDRIFGSYTAWLEHERLSHRRVWQCFEHNEPKFQSKDELRYHLQSEHGSNITETQIQSLIDVSESSVADTRTTCPFCLLEGPFSKGFENHLASHMLTFATFAVPRDESVHGRDNVNADESQSIRAQGLGSQGSEVSESLRFDSQPPSAEASNADHQAFQSSSQSISDETSLSDVDHNHILREEERGIAILIEKALRPSPINIPTEMINLNKAIESSKFLRVGMQDESERIPSVRLEKDGAILYDEGGIGIEAFCSPLDQTGEIVCAAEKLTRAKLFRGLRPNVGERLPHDLKLHFEVVVPGSQRAILPSGESHIFEDEKACIWLDNKGGRTLYVNIFDINVTGQIFLINVDNPGGIEIEGQSTYVYGQNKQGEAEGEAFSWPDSVPICEAISESLLFIVTENIINLQHVESPGMIGRGETPKSTLEDLTFQIACGGARNYGQSRRQVALVRFDVIEIPFTLHPRTCTGETVPDPQKCEEWPKTLKSWPEIDETAAKGFFGAVLRAGHGIPPCIWVTNKYTEQITVVVSKLRPSRLWTGSELNISATGGGVTFSTETYALPTTKKTLGPYTNGQSPVTAIFPLWNRKEGCGVVCIYLGKEERCFIINDQVPIGATAVFTGQPDVEIIEYKELKR